MAPAPSQFGYKSKKEPFPQLAQLLGISDSVESSEELKNTLRELAGQYLDVDLTPQKQTGALMRIGKKLLRQLPHFFAKEEEEKEKRLYYALRAVSRIHYHKRCKRRRLSEQKKGLEMQSFTGHVDLRQHDKGEKGVIEMIDSESSESESLMMSEGNGTVVAKDSRSPNNHAKAPSTMAKNGRLPPTRIQVADVGDFPMALQDLPPARHAPLLTRTEGLGSSSSNTLPAYFKLVPRALNAGSSMQDPAFTSFQKHSKEVPEAPMDDDDNTISSQTRASTRVTEARWQDHAKSATNPNQDPTQAYTVCKFLENCCPSLNHLLMSFVNYGCTTEEYLRSLATFSQVKRREGLRRILADHSNIVEEDEGDRGVSEMDFEVLEEQLERRFL